VFLELKLMTKAALVCAILFAGFFSSGQDDQARARSVPSATDAAYPGYDGRGFAIIGSNSAREMAQAILNIWDADTQWKQSKASGTVVLECNVKRDGSIGKINVIQSSGDKALDDTAISTAKKASL
jgi:hypothetical protein